MTASPLDEVRRAYDTVAASYAELVTGLSAEGLLDVAMLNSFVEQVRGKGAVLDAGCGPGRIAGYLASHGVEVSGIDLSSAMVREARLRYPALHFEVGELLHLPVTDDSLAGVLAWYSIIHTAPLGLPAVFAEFHRVLLPDGHLLLGIQVGDGVFRVTQSYGHDVGVDLQLLRTDDVTALLESSGFSVVASLTRAAEGRERRPQGFVLARKMGDRRPA